MKQSSPTRIAAIDNAKALGILFVVLGHIVSPSYYVSNLIFAFQVPLFFALSGYLLSSGKLKLGAGAFTRHTAARLLLPYVLFGLLLYVPWFLVFRHFGAGVGVPPLKPLAGILYGLGTDGWLQQSPPLWFLPALFIATLLTYAITKAEKRLQWPLAFIFANLGILASLSPVTFPFSSANAMLAVPFMLAGVQWRAKGLPLRPAGSRAIAALALGSIALLTIVAFNGEPDFNAMRFGTYGLALYLPAALLGIMLTVIISAMLPASKVAEAVSNGTLYILALHIPFFTVIKGIALKVLHIPTADWSTNPALILLISATAIALSLVVQFTVQRGRGLIEVRFPKLKLR